MTFDPTKPVQTQGGCKAEICYNDGKLIVAVTHRIAGKTAHEYDQDGKALYSPESFDLINIPEKRVGYINFYGSGYAGYAYDTRAKADQLSKTCRIACVRVEYEDGQFDD